MFLIPGYEILQFQVSFFYYHNLLHFCYVYDSFLEGSSVHQVMRYVNFSKASDEVYHDVFVDEIPCTERSS